MATPSGILFLLTLRTVLAGVVIQPTYPFETDVSKYKLLEEFYPENDRNAVPIAQFLEKLRSAKYSDQGLGNSDHPAYSIFPERRSLPAMTNPIKHPNAYAFPYRRDLTGEQPWKNQYVTARGEENPLTETLHKVVSCLKESFPKELGFLGKQRAGENTSMEMNGILVQAISDAMGKVAQEMLKKLPFVKYVTG